ncbi:MAG: TVP38/TMEM64 family protein [Clostridia bacterium]|nr:TVP38/TMEM64 family protein [Clostridia bacterium]
MKKKVGRSYIMNFAAFICFLLALAMIIFLRLIEVDEAMEWYYKYTETLSNFEQWIQTYGATWGSVLIILGNFVLKAIIPWFPISCICVVSGALFPAYYAIPINIVGLAVLFTIKFFWGKRFGGGNAEKILRRYDRASKFIDKSKLGSTLVLFFLRLVPCLPINSVSQLYGTTGINYWKYLVVSVLGFSYKLFSYTVIGRNVYDPLSAKFMLPFVFLFLFSGFVLLGLNGVLGLTGYLSGRKAEQ